MNKDNRDTSDYIDVIDGLRHCSVCYQAKEMKLNIFGMERVLPCACKCVEDREQQEKLASTKLKVHEQLTEWVNCGLSTLSEFDTFDVDDHEEQKVSDLCRRYSERWKAVKSSGKGLMLYGNPGSGKTFYASAIANYLINNGTSVLMTRVSNLIDKMGFDATEDILKIIRNVPLLILDDFGSERNTEYANEKIFQIIDTRYQVRNEGKPLIITTNLTVNDMKSETDRAYQRIYSRINEMCTGLLVTHDNRRRTMYGKNKDELTSILTQ